ncbi:MAG TPA: PadR family transcriptional regulator [Prolixibacteraceae bacterium]|nr:PadR family transcriptional regulator [Prolixibacteraceae bacterium]
MKLEKTKAQLKKGVLEYCILSVLGNEPLYISDILLTLEKSDLVAVEGTVYPMLVRLKNEGYLGYHWEEAGEGQPRKYYSLTEPGKAFLGELGKFWNELNKAVLNMNSKM